MKPTANHANHAKIRRDEFHESPTSIFSVFRVFRGSSSQLAGQTVKLHQEFAIGVHDKNDLASFLSRCDTVLASVQNAANLAALRIRPLR